MTAVTGVGIDDPRGDAGERAAHGTGARAGAAGVGDVDRHDRRHFRAAITLDQIDAELLLERARDRLAQPLRADDRQPQRRELFRLALPGVGAQRSAC